MWRQRHTVMGWAKSSELFSLLWNPYVTRVDVSFSRNYFVVRAYKPHDKPSWDVQYQRSTDAKMQQTRALESSPSWVTVLSCASNSTMMMIKGRKTNREACVGKHNLTWWKPIQRKTETCHYTNMNNVYYIYYSLSFSACEWHRDCNNLYEYCMWM